MNVCKVLINVYQKFVSKVHLECNRSEMFAKIALLSDESFAEYVMLATKSELNNTSLKTEKQIQEGICDLLKKGHTKNFIMFLLSKDAVHEYASLCSLLSCEDLMRFEDKIIKGE